MNYEEARLYLEHTSKEDFNLEEWQKENRYQAIQVVLKEIERLKQGYCLIKEKCNKGECDCTNEEYNQMCEENTKLDLEIERLNNIINKAIEYLKSKECYKKWEIDGDEVQNNLLSILQGVDKE